MLRFISNVVAIRVFIALYTIVLGEQPGFQAMSVLLPRCLFAACPRLMRRTMNDSLGSCCSSLVWDSYHQRIIVSAMAVTHAHALKHSVIALSLSPVTASIALLPITRVRYVYRTSTCKKTRREESTLQPKTTRELENAFKWGACLRRSPSPHASGVCPERYVQGVCSCLVCWRHTKKYCRPVNCDHKITDGRHHPIEYCFLCRGIRYLILPHTLP